MSDKAIPELRSKFEEDGFAVVEGAIEPFRCDDVIEEVWRLMPQRFSRDDPESWSGKISDCCNSLPLYQRNGLLRYKDKHGFRRNAVIERHLYSNPCLGQLYERVTGQPFGRLRIRGLHPVLQMPRWISINEATGNRLDPRANGQERPWPKIPRPPQLPIFGHLDVHPVDVLMMLYLDDVSPDGGALAVWPGSHRLLQHCFNSKYEFFPTPAYRLARNFLQQFRPVHVAGRKGDVIVFHNRLFHSNSINEDRRIRHAVLLDVFGRDWLEQDRHWMGDQALTRHRKSLVETKHIESHSLARSVAAGLNRDRARNFWSKHPRLMRVVSGIAKDPSGKARRRLSAKIRERREGDCWIVVSQDQEHRNSPKLDSYGTKDLGRFAFSLNGGRKVRSIGGVVVERIDPIAGKNVVEVRGKFAVDHYVRIIRSRNPIDQSEILYSGEISATPDETCRRISFRSGTSSKFD